MKRYKMKQNDIKKIEKYLVKMSKQKDNKKVN
jgi:hypothetical protein